MGIDYNSARMILFAQKNGADLTNMATLGRQETHFDSRQAEKLLTAFGHRVSDNAFRGIFGDRYCEGFLSAVGARSIDSIDNAAYEKATVIHDMNLPVPAGLRGRYDTIVDGGSTEHIFNFPTAIKNCMDMLKVGGHFVSITAGNNCLGHGFYQFSPEIYFRLFDEANGFRTKAVILADIASPGNWHLVPDPKTLGGRVGLVNDRPTYIMVLAEKLRDTGALQTPQQSDYVTAWDEDRPYVDVHHANPGGGGWLRTRLKAALPYALLELIGSLRAARVLASERGFAVRKYYRDFDPSRDSVS